MKSQTARSRKVQAPAVEKDEENDIDQLVEPKAAIRWLWILVAVAIVVILGVWFSMSTSSNAGNSPYSAVYLVTGDVYFGKLSWFPEPHMTDVYVLQRSTDPTQAVQVQVLPLSSVFWAPGNTVYLNAHDIVFSAPLSLNSPVAKVIADPALLQTGAPPATSSSSTTSTQ